MDELSEGTKVAFVRDRTTSMTAMPWPSRSTMITAATPTISTPNFILGYIPRTKNAEIAAMLDAGYFDNLYDISAEFSYIC